VWIAPDLNGLEQGEKMSRTILVTGGAGYIGSQLIRDLAADERFQGDTIRIYDNLQRGNHHVLMDLPEGVQYQFAESDILDRQTLAENLEGVWAVVHLAALVSTPISFDNPRWTYQINHWGTANLVEQAVHAGVQRLIYTCSASVYGPGGPFSEGDRCTPVGPYSISKLQGEEVVMQAGEKRHLDVVSLRLGNVFGRAPGLRYEAVANRFAYLAGIGKPLIVYGSGEHKCPLIHIRDASSAIRFCLAERSLHGQIVNAAAMNLSSNELVEVVQRLRPEAAVRYTSQDAPTQISYEISSQRLNDLGWSAQHGIEAGLGEIMRGLSAISTRETIELE
jgi:UDP-glucose 4-epimerase